MESIMRNIKAMLGSVVSILLNKNHLKTCLTNGDLKNNVVLCLLKTMFSKNIFKDKKTIEANHRSYSLAVSFLL